MKKPKYESASEDAKVALFSVYFDKYVYPPGFELVESDDEVGLMDPEGVYTRTGTEARAIELAWKRFEAWTKCNRESWALRKASAVITGLQERQINVLEETLAEVGGQHAMKQKEQEGVIVH